MLVVIRNVGVTEALHELVPEWLLELVTVISLLGDWLVLVPLLGLVYLFDIGSSLRRGLDETEPFCSTRTAFVIATVFGGLAFTLLLKALFGAPRPPAELHAVTPSENGFPSGHTMVATIGWGAIAWWLVDGRRTAATLVVALVVALVALSRLVLGVHFFVDVIASVVFGLLYLGLVAATIELRPLPVFLLAFVLALLATVVSGGAARPLLALVGITVTIVGWRTLEFLPVRRRVVRLVNSATAR